MLLILKAQHTAFPWPERPFDPVWSFFPVSSTIFMFPLYLGRHLAGRPQFNSQSNTLQVLLKKNEKFKSFIRSGDWVLFGVQFHRNARLFLGVRLENGCNPGRHFGCGPNLAFFDDEPFVPVLSMAPPRWNESPAEFHWIIIAVSVCWQQINFFYWLAPSKLLFSATLTGQPMENFRWFAAIFLRHSSAVISFYQCWTRKRPWLVKYCVKCAESRNALAPAAILDPTSCNFSCQQNRVTWTQINSKALNLNWIINCRLQSVNCFRNNSDLTRMLHNVAS